MVACRPWLEPRLTCMPVTQVASIEAHGTGTTLGDPTEVGALTQCFQDCHASPKAIGASKASMGHSEPVAGHLGLLNVSRSLSHQALSANAQLRILNRLLPRLLASSEVGLLLPAQGVEDHGPQGVGGVSSFGYSGTIAHAVLSDEGIAQRTDLPWLLLIYNRRIFPWRDVHHTRRANTARYATCWAASAVRLSETTASQPRMLVLTSGVGLPFLPVSSAPEGEWQSGVLMLAGSWSVAPSLQGTQVALALTQQVAGWLGAQCVLMLTSGTQVASADAAHAASDAAHGGVWGLARVLRLEHAGVRIHSADVSRGPSATTSVRALITGPEAATEAEMACGPRGSCAARLRPCCAVDMRADVVVSGRYAITGGLGGLGLRAAALVAACGVRRVLLASRSGRVARDGQGLSSQLQSLGTRAEVVACDNAAASDTTALVRCGNHVTGLLHAAGSGDEGLSAYLVALRLSLMYAPKAFGAWHLHAALTALPLECRVLFSSVGAGLSNIGQANYAAANACLDADALSMRSCGVVVCSLQWPLIGGAGMGAALHAAAGKRQASTTGAGMGAVTFSTEQLNAMGAITLHEFALWLAHCLIPSHSSTECTQTLLAPQSLEKARSSRALPRCSPIMVPSPRVRRRRLSCSRSHACLAALASTSG